MARATTAGLNVRLELAHLYAISDERPPRQLIAWAAACVAGGAAIVQLRHKSSPRGERVALARAMASAVHEGGGLFIVDDDLDVAMLSDADGVHLGPDDLSVGAARALVGDRMLIGASASTPAAAAAAVRAGADYIGCGPAFPTPIKPAKSVIGPAGIARVAREVSVPVFAIGGIDESNLGQLVAAGVRRACVIRALAGLDPAPVAARLREALQG